MSETGSTGRRLGGYRLGRRIAVGGMAEIFEAERVDGGGPPLVVKRLLPGQAKDPEVVRMLAHEGQLMRRLSHDHLVRVVDVEASGDEPFLVLERVDGASLAELLDAMAERGERPTDAMALAVMLPLLDALAHVHAATDDDGAPLNVVHRDVTPQNVLIARDGTVLLGDFGIARSSLRDARTRTGVIKGKLRYLAPEQVTGSDVDARTDLYAAAVILWELLAGQPYLTAESDAGLVRAAEAPEFRPTGDPRFDPLLARALARFPEARPASASALRRGLVEAVEGLDVGPGRAAWAAEVGDVVGPTLVAAPRSRPRRRGLRVAGLLAALAVAGVGYIALDRPAANPSASAGETSASADPADEAPSATASAPLAGSASEEAPPDPAAAEVPPANRAATDPTPAATAEARPSGSAATDARAARAQPGARAGSRRPRVAPEEAPEALPPEPAPEPTDDAGLAAARSELAALRSSLDARGILADDLVPAQRAGLTAVDAALRDGDAAAARERLAPLRAELDAVRVDDAFVRAKLGRVDRRIRALRARGEDTAEIERLSALALEDLLARRPEATNRRLNQILRRLR